MMGDAPIPSNWKPRDPSDHVGRRVDQIVANWLAEDANKNRDAKAEAAIEGLVVEQPDLSWPKDGS